MKPILFLVLSAVLLNTSAYAQELSASELLERSIQYHDPNGNWETFSGTLNIRMETPKASPRFSKIKIDLPKEFFSLSAKRDSIVTTYSLNRSKCVTSITDSTNLSRTPCETALLYKNYYTYLYGLPMKLKDPGALISEKVSRKKFNGKEYLVLKVSYEEQVGNDVWFFYFNPSTFAMEIYQFFKGDPQGSGKNTGEYILLSEEEIVNGVRMPKIRAWYYNKNDEYLGTDTLHK